MPRRALRMLEETWQIAVNQLGLSRSLPGHGPGQQTAAQNQPHHLARRILDERRRSPAFQCPQGGLHDEGWGNPVPHEFAHTVQAGQIDFLNGCHWESHANYLRFCRNYHFREFTGLDSIDFGVLLRSNYFQDHPRLIYADYRPYFYLDNDPDQLGFAPGLSAKLWQTGVKDERLWERLPKLLPARRDAASRWWPGWRARGSPSRFHAGEHCGIRISGRTRTGASGGSATWLRSMPVADRPDWFAVPLAKAPMKFGWCLS